MVFKDIMEEPDGEFGLKEVERYQVFRIGGGEVWYNDGTEFKMQDDWTNTLTEIPVVWIKTGKEVSRFQVIPKLYDIS